MNTSFNPQWIVAFVTLATIAGTLYSAHDRQKLMKEALESQDELISLLRSRTHWARDWIMYHHGIIEQMWPMAMGRVKLPTKPDSKFMDMP